MHGWCLKGAKICFRILDSNFTVRYNYVAVSMHSEDAKETTVHLILGFPGVDSYTGNNPGAVLILLKPEER